MRVTLDETRHTRMALERMEVAHLVKPYRSRRLNMKKVGGGGGWLVGWLVGL